MAEKILYIASTDAHLRSFHLPYIAALLDAGCTVVCAGRGDGHGLPEGAAFLSVPFTKRFFAPQNLRASLLLAKTMRAERFDTVLVHTSLAAFFTRLGVMLAGKKHTRVVNTVHGYLFDDRSPLCRRTVLLWAEKLTAGVTDEILTMNREDTLIARAHRLCRGTVTEIPGMGVPMEKYVPVTESGRRAAREQLEIPEEAHVLLCAAEFSKRKNQAMLVRSLTRLPDNVLLLLPGTGELLEECRTLADSLGVAHRVRFPGFCGDLTPYLRAADLCVSASRSEGLPFHAMEAMACALPTVLSDVKGHRDLTEAGITGALYPFNDEAAFAAAVGPYLSPALCREQGQNARQKVLPYALEAVLPQVLPHYRAKK